MPQKMGAILTFIDASQVHISPYYTVNMGALQIALLSFLPAHQKGFMARALGER